MTDAIFSVDDDNAVIRYYPSRLPVSSPSAGSARRRVIATLLPSLQALAEYLGRVTGTSWTVVDAEAQDDGCSHLADSDEPGDGMDGPCQTCGRYYVDEDAA